METLKVLITVKTYPQPSPKYGELVCTAGILEDGGFVRLYPVNFRDRPFSQQYQKYQWVEVQATKHQGFDSRKESYRPNCETLVPLGNPIGTHNNWKQRSEFVLRETSPSMEVLYDAKDFDQTSLGIIRPKQIFDLEISEDTPDWPPKVFEELRQARLFDDRPNSHEPPRKVPFKFHYRFSCDDRRCNANHRMHIEDWEVGALYWRLIDKGASPKEAANNVKAKFLDEICSSRNDTHLFVGTVLRHGTWVVIGTYYPKKDSQATLGF